MPRNSTGTFGRVNNSFSDPIADTIISDSDATALWADYDAALTDSLSRSGKGGMQAALDMGTHQINNVSAPAADADAVNKTYADTADATNLAAAKVYADAAVATGISGSIHGTPVGKTGAYGIVNADKGKTFYFGGSAYYTVTVGAASGFDADFQCRIINPDSRGKLISINGISAFILWPGQTITIVNTNNVWAIYPLTQRWLSTTQLTLNVDPVAGSDSNDGLATGAGNALRTIPQAYRVIIRQWIDTRALAPIIQLVAGTYSLGAGLDVNYPLVGVSQFSIQGDLTSSLNAAATYILSCSPGAAAINSRDLSTVTLVGLKVATSGNGSTGISATNETNVDPTNCVFAAFPLGTVMTASTHADINIGSALRFEGNAVSIMSVSMGGVIQATSFTHEVPNTMTVTNWMVAGSGGVINAGCAYSGAGSGAGTAGTQYTVTTAGGILSAGASTIPGTIVPVVTAPGWTT